VDGVWGLGEDRGVGGATTATECAAAAVEERELDARLLRPTGDERLRFVECEGRRDRSDVLRRVGVAEHDLHAATGLRETRRDLRVRDDLGEDAGGRLQVG